jgi:hypothetical protein
LKVLDPALGDYLPESGREVTESSYWYRQLRDKSVILGVASERKNNEPEAKKTKPETEPAGENDAPAAPAAVKKTKKK